MNHEYTLTADQIAAFQRDGYVHLPGVLSAAELAEIEAVYERFLAGEIPVEGKDLCDMSGGYDRPVAEFELINVMLPRRYWPQWRGNVLERRAASIAEQLCGPGMQLDYDQLLAKRPGAEAAEFAWHQDQAYWLPTTDPRTATIWLALDDTTRENGCMRFVAGSNREPELRAHRPLRGSREESHTLVCAVDEAADDVRYACLARGDVTVHDQRVVHGSGGNTSAGWRRGYVVAFRSETTVREERARGFTHSHNDDATVLGQVDAF